MSFLQAKKLKFRPTKEMIGSGIHRDSPRWFELSYRGLEFE